LCPALDEYFPKSMGVHMIAEPGRFFVASAFTLAVNIIAKRAVPRGEGYLGMCMSIYAISITELVFLLK